MANLTPQGGNADLAGKTVTTIDGYTVTYDNAGFARRSVSPDGQVKTYDALGNQVGTPTYLDVSPAVDPNVPVLPVSTEMPISDVLPESSILRNAEETTSPYGEQNDPLELPLAENTEPAEDPYAVTTDDTEGPTEADLEVDPLNDEALAQLEQQQADNRFDLEVENVGPEPLAPEEDPFEQARQDAEDAYNAEGPTEADLEVDPQSDEALAQQEEEQALNREALRSEDAQNAASEAAFREKAKQQATFQARYKQPGNQDWRVRLSLGPNANYLYNAGTPRGSGAGILAPLAATDGVIFPYTPSITTTYSANYEQYDLVHSNYRGVFYKNSRVGDINIRGTFTAQDTAEANYLLAVIHFFRSATKMFYGQDAERGTPPPVCLLNGLGSYQFSDHPVVISSFNYTTPNDVDYIRAVNPNNYGDNLLNRRAAVASNPGGSSLAGAFRLVNALLPKGAKPQVPGQGTVNGTVANTTGATYVPTKIEIDITLIPVQTRAQVSKQFSLQGFAEGRLLKGGFW